ncbi:MAG TPA: hypothetical protein DCP92_24780 [Nitrospiraceae bacterium]|nr:hypothetical protein [Nitrospiraceae bacterium]
MRDFYTPIMNWISVKDRLPPNNHCVITWDGEFVSQFDYYDAKSGQWFVIGDCCHDDSLVGRLITHWMPLPEPPSADEKSPS